MSHKLFKLIGLLVIASFVLAACGGAAAPTEAPTPAPAAVEACQSSSTSCGASVMVANCWG